MLLTDVLRFLLTIFLALSLIFDYPLALKSFTRDTLGLEDTSQIAPGYPWIDSDLAANVTVHSPEDPREDFHLYASKDLLLKKKYVEGYSVWNSYADATSKVDDRAMELVEKLQPYDHDSELVRDLYDILIDWYQRDETGFSEIKELTDPIIEAENLDELTDYLLTDDGLLFIVNLTWMYVENSVNDPDLYVVYIAPEDLLLGDSAEYSERTEYGDMTASYNEKMFLYYAERVGIGKDEAEKMLDLAYDLETKLAEKIPASEEMMRDDYILKANNEMSFEELEELSGNYPLIDLVEASDLKYDGPYIITEPDYLKYLNEIYTEENFEAIRSLIFINALLDLGEYSDRDAYDTELDTNNECYNMGYWYTDQENAYDSLANMLEEPLQKVYVDEYGSEEDKEQLEGLCEGMIDCYRSMLSDNTWASDETKKHAIEKLDAMQIHVAYPDKWNDYSSLSLAGCSLLEAQRRIWTFLDNLYDARLGKEADNECWALEINTLECNASYSLTENAIYIYMGMMEEPFYYEGMSTEELYASVGGFWLGHEISHSFDSQGSRYDAEGKLNNWWSEEDDAEFRRRIEKLDAYLDTIEPFGDYKVNGKTVDVEMLADITGLQCALKMASQEEDFDYDAFFRKFAEMNAGIVYYSQELSSLLQDEHPLEYLRTNVTVQQFDEYYETYGTAEGDGMYLAPEDRLTVW